MGLLILGVGKKGEELTVDKNGDTLKSYTAWFNLLRRCYSDKELKRNPTYKGCFVCRNWLTFKNFKKWHDENYIDGFSLDKDLLVIGNKEYSPTKCRFVPTKLNTLFIDCGNNRGDYPIGVSYKKKNKNYVSQIRVFGEVIHIGSYNTIEKAHMAYRKVKKSHCTIQANNFYKNGDIKRDLYLSLIKRISLI